MDFLAAMNTCDDANEAKWHVRMSVWIETPSFL
jgi:hypothetical protein